MMEGGGGLEDASSLWFPGLWWGLAMPMAGLVGFSDAEHGSKRGCWSGESPQTRQVWARSHLQSGCTNSRSFPKLHLTFN